LDVYDHYVELLDQAASEIEQEKRKEIFYELQKIILEEAWQIIIAVSPYIWGEHSYVEGFDPNAGGSYEWNFTRVWLNK
jgi:ABC-type transport system substrate-binding protein